MINKTPSGKFLIGVISGAITGALIALLYAPASGRRLRREIVHKKNDLLNDANKYLRKAKAQAIDMIEEGKRKAEDMINEAKKKVENISDSAVKLVK